MGQGSMREWVTRTFEEANLRQRNRIRELEEEVARLERDNTRIRAAMKRCLTCEYRTEILAQRSAATG